MLNFKVLVVVGTIEKRSRWESVELEKVVFSLISACFAAPFHIAALLTASTSRGFSASTHSLQNHQGRSKGSCVSNMGKQELSCRNGQ